MTFAAKGSGDRGLQRPRNTPTVFHPLVFHASEGDITTELVGDDEVFPKESSPKNLLVSSVNEVASLIPTAPVLEQLLGQRNPLARSSAVRRAPLAFAATDELPAAGLQTIRAAAAFIFAKGCWGITYSDNRVEDAFRLYIQRDKHHLALGCLASLSVLLLLILSTVSVPLSGPPDHPLWWASLLLLMLSVLCFLACCIGSVLLLRVDTRGSASISPSASRESLFNPNDPSFGLLTEGGGSMLSASRIQEIMFLVFCFSLTGSCVTFYVKSLWCIDNGHQRVVAGLHSCVDMIAANTFLAMVAIALVGYAPSRQALAALLLSQCVLFLTRLGLPNDFDDVGSIVPNVVMQILFTFQCSLTLIRRVEANHGVFEDHVCHVSTAQQSKKLQNHLDELIETLLPRTVWSRLVSHTQHNVAISSNAHSPTTAGLLLDHNRDVVVGVAEFVDFASWCLAVLPIDVANALAFLYNRFDEVMGSAAGVRGEADTKSANSSLFGDSLRCGTQRSLADMRVDRMYAVGDRYVFASGLLPDVLLPDESDVDANDKRLLLSGNRVALVMHAALALVREVMSFVQRVRSIVDEPLHLTVAIAFGEAWGTVSASTSRLSYDMDGDGLRQALRLSSIASCQTRGERYSAVVATDQCAEAVCASVAPGSLSTPLNSLSSAGEAHVCTDSHTRGLHLRRFQLPSFSSEADVSGDSLPNAPTVSVGAYVVNDFDIRSSSVPNNILRVRSDGLLPTTADAQERSISRTLPNEMRLAASDSTRHTVVGNRAHRSENRYAMLLQLLRPRTAERGPAGSSNKAGPPRDEESGRLNGHRAEPVVSWLTGKQNTSEGDDAVRSVLLPMSESSDEVNANFGRRALKGLAKHFQRLQTSDLFGPIWPDAVKSGLLARLLLPPSSLPFANSDIEESFAYFVFRLYGEWRRRAYLITASFILVETIGAVIDVSLRTGIHRVSRSPALYTNALLFAVCVLRIVSPTPLVRCFVDPIVTHSKPSAAAWRLFWLDYALAIALNSGYVLSQASLPPNAFNNSSDYLMSLIVLTTFIHTRFVMYAAFSLAVHGVCICCAPLITHNGTNLFPVPSALNVICCWVVGVVATFVRLKSLRVDFEEKCRRVAVCSAADDEFHFLRQLHSLLLPQFALDMSLQRAEAYYHSIRSDVANGAAAAAIGTQCKGLKDCCVLEVRLGSVSVAVNRQGMATAAFQSPLDIIDSVLYQAMGEVPEITARGAEYPLKVMSRIASHGDTSMYAGPLIPRSAHEDEVPPDAAEDAEYERNLLDAMTAIIIFLRRIAVQKKTGGPDLFPVAARLTAVAVLGSTVGALIGSGRAPAFIAVGYAPRLSHLLLAAAPEGCLALTESFLRYYLNARQGLQKEVIDSNVCCNELGSEFAFSKASTWRVRGCGIIRMSSVADTSSVYNNSLPDPLNPKNALNN